MKDKDVVTVVAATGEYVGRMVKIDETGIVLEKPRLITYNEEGMGFAQGIAMTGNPDPKEVTILSAVFVTECNEEIVKAWQTATSGIIL
jgi:hypothetical protein|tara:strand:- start:7060 stop:7326 length:267 start_codon:yes stop_codon:yes gene_type:complete